MYHYLFTNDLRISILDSSIQEAGNCFLNGNVPSSSINKSANNNMMTLGFYFNLNEISECAMLASKGEIRKVVLNFIKKFQFPNPRTIESLTLAQQDGIKLAPMRMITKLLYIVLMSEGNAGFITIDEIRNFIFYNDKVAKTTDSNISEIYQDIKLFRKNGILPSYIEQNLSYRVWNHEGRQIREMLKILQWSGCVYEDKNGNLRIQQDILSRSDKADIFEIVNETSFWDEVSIESYRKYFDVEPIEENKEKDPYYMASSQLKNFILSTSLEFEDSDESIDKVYKEFGDRFSPEVLSRIPDEELLKSLFYASESTNDSLCYWLEFHAQSRKLFGSIAGGSAFKFILYQRKVDGIWVTGNPKVPTELSIQEAIIIGKEIRDNLVRGAELISNFGNLVTLSDYELLDVELHEIIGKYANIAWIHKYFHMIFPQKFSIWHSTEWQNHVLLAFGIKPSDKYYGRSGQLSIVCSFTGLSQSKFGIATYEEFGDIKRFIRIGTTEGTEYNFPQWKTEKIVSIGWPNIGTLENYRIENEISKKSVEEILKMNYYPEDNRQASRKAGELVCFYKTDKDSVFVAMNGEKLIALGDNIGIYKYDQDSNFSHNKSVEWRYLFVDGEKLPKKTEGLLTSCVQLTDFDNLLFLYRKLYFGFITDIQENEENKIVTKHSPRKDKRHPLNMILFGAPGTGKTYSTIEYSMAIIENRDFDDTPKTLEEREALMVRYNYFQDSGNIVFTTFHQSYGYEEFIQGIRPDSNSESIRFIKADGVFKKIVTKALNDSSNNYVIIIDEINRGNISKIFGELITLIEEDKRYGEINQIKVTLPLGDPFCIPNNLYIVGTMNSADKSISLIDTALRRRFSFVEMIPNDQLIADVILREVLKKLNIALKRELRSNDLLIGHSYFIDKSYINLGEIMNRNIIPLLYEYFFDDEIKISKVLECINGTGFIIDPESNGRIRIMEKNSE